MEGNYAPDYLFPMFDEEIKKVWKNWDKAINFDNIRIRIRNQDCLMSIRSGHLNYSSRAIGLNLTHRVGDKDSIVLFIAPRTLKLSEQEIRGLMRHEALHFGYPRHDSNFKYYVKEINAPFTEYSMNDNGDKKYVVSYQPRKGARFIKLKEFDDVNEAKQFSHSYMRANMVKTKTAWKI